MKRILLLAAVLFAAIQLSAAPVDMVSAQAKAQRFVQQQLYGGKLRGHITGDMKLVHTEMSSQRPDLAVFYIFNTQNGHVVVSGDDRSEEILGYGDYPLNYNEIPCNMKALFGMLKEQIEYLQSHKTLQTYTPSLNGTRTASVEPLLTAMWDQEAPYWKQCVINGSQCLTGCPATSASMVFHYWKYPDYETPTVPGYRCELSTGYWSSSYVNVAALPPVTFDWDNMLDRYNNGGYNTAQADAVATLMRYVGQAEHMAYGTSAAGGSGVDADSVILIANAFKLFGYDEETVRVVKKTSAYSGGQTLYTNEEWAAIMQEELSEGRPIVFCAVAGGMFGGGHAFNVDGYDSSTNKYHINFGWSGDYNSYYAINSFTAQGSTFNQYQQMVIGIQPPVHSPRLRADASSLSMECYKNQTTTTRFKVTGRNLEGNVTLTLVDENDVFSIDKTTVTPDEDAKVSETITVTYAPKAEGNFHAKVVVSTPGLENFEVALTGTSVYELYRPMMQPIDESTVTSTSFRADWTDATPVENVVSYTLEVKAKPDVVLLSEGDWSNVPKEDTNHASDAQNYLPEGWTFSGSKFYLDGGFISASRNSVITAYCDLMGYNIVSVIIKAKSYTKGSNTQLTISTDLESQTLTLAQDVETYLVVLEAGSRSAITFTTGYYPEIQSIKIYGGLIEDLTPFSLRGAVVTGDDKNMLIEGIYPDKSYVVNGLVPGVTYFYRVMSHYVDGTESKWSSMREVTLPESAIVLGDVDADGKIDINDLTVFIDCLLNETTPPGNGDMDGDGELTITDLTILIDCLLNQ